MLTDEEMSKIRVNWDELIQYNGAMLKLVIGETEREREG